MGKAIHSGALTILNRILGIAGSRTGASQTDLDDGNLSQVLNVNPIVRRSRTPGNTGWFYFLIENNHAGADDEVGTVDPYGIGAGGNGAVAPYPIAPVDGGKGVPPDLEVHLIGVGLNRNSASGALAGALCAIIPLTTQQGFGVDDAGAQHLAGININVARWDSINSATTAFGEGVGVSATGVPFVPVNMRIPRGALIRFSSTSGAAAIFTMYGVLGLFPISLGQDVSG